MKPITVREAQRGDQEALARIHAEVARYYLDLAPDSFRCSSASPARQLASETPANDSATLHLVAEAGVKSSARSSLGCRPRTRRNGGARRSWERRDLRIEDRRRRGGKPKARRRCPPCRGSGGMGTSRGRDDRRNNEPPRKPALVPFWGEHMNYEELSVNLRKPL